METRDPPAIALPAPPSASAGGPPPAAGKEQSATEVPLIKIHKAGKIIEGITTFPEPGVCKNLLHQYAQKMNYSHALYECNNAPCGLLTCTVWIGGIKYTGASARTKKEAEINAARAALLAIKENSKTIGMGGAHQNPTLCPVRKKKKKKKKQERETNVPKQVQQLRVDKASFKRYCSSRRFSRGIVQRMAKLNELGAATDGDKMPQQKAAGDLDKIGTGKTMKDDNSFNCQDEQNDGSIMALEVKSLEESQGGKIMDDMVKIPWDDYIPL